VQTVVQLTLLGGFAARLSSGPALAFPRKKSEALLAYLAMHAGQRQARDKLAALLWGETTDARARHSLRQALVALRRAMPARTAALLVEDGDAVAVNPAAIEVDALHFQRLAAAGTPEALQRAAALYRGDLLEGLAVAEPPFEAWLSTERERLREMALEALVRLLAHQMRGEATEPALQTALRVLGLDPAQEAVHRAVMQLHARRGRRAAALRQYQVCVGVLERELGLEPEAETKQLYREILQAARADGGPTAPGVRPAPPPLPGPGSDTPLVGRRAELARLQAALDEAWRGHGAVALVHGEAGVGKSRLVEAVVTAAHATGGRVLLGRAHESEQVLPFSPWVDALRSGHVVPHLADELADPWRAELARLFPELRGAASEPPTGDDYVRLFEALARVVQYLASGSPLLVVLEDLHWADDMSHRLLLFLARRIPDWPVLVLGTVRGEELVGAPVLRRSTSQLARQPRFLSLTLAPLSDVETTALVRALTRGRLDEAAIERLAGHVWRASEGNAFMAIETLRMLEAGDPSTATAPGMAAPVRDMIAARLERLTDAGRRLAGLASVIGREFDFAVLAHAGDLGAAQAAEGVEELVARRILHATGERLDFTHDRLREVAYDLVLPPHRTLLHGAVARALEALHPDDLAAHALALGRHHAASEAWDRAWGYLAQAGTQAASRYAHREAVVCFEEALEALGRLPPTPERLDRAIEIRFELRQSCVPLRDHRRILTHVQEAEAAAQAIGDRRRLAWALVYRTHGLFLAGEGDPAREAGERAARLAAELGDPSLGESAAFYLAQAHHWLGGYAEGAALLRHAVTTVEAELARAGLPARQFVNSRMLLAWCLAELGEFGEALARAGEAVQAAERHARAYDLVHACCGAGLAHLRRGDPDAAAVAGARAAELCRGRDFSALWAISASILGSAYTSTGRAAEAIPLLERAAEIAAALAAPTLGFLAEAYLAAGRVDRAQATADEALRLAVGRGERGWHAWTLFRLGNIGAQRPEGEGAAADHYRRALFQAERLGMRPLAAHCHLGLGLVYRRTERAHLAQAHVGRAVAMYQAMAMDRCRAAAEAETARVV
jgi:DNA-binding SARP family transcriptional activator